MGAVIPLTPALSRKGRGSRSVAIAVTPRVPSPLMGEGEGENTAATIVRENQQYDHTLMGEG